MVNLEFCMEGKHSLTQIYISGYEDHPCDVVRWCTVCGAVVVDVDVDGRIYPGDIVKMKFPTITREMMIEKSKT